MRHVWKLRNPRSAARFGASLAAIYRDIAHRDIENWIKFYNERRLHSTIGYQSPAEARRTWQERMT